MLRKTALSVSVKWLAVKTASEITYILSSGALNSTPTNQGGIFNIHLTTNLSRNLPVNSRFGFDRIVAISLWPKNWRTRLALPPWWAVAKQADGDDVALWCHIIGSTVGPTRTMGRQQNAIL